MLALHRWFFRWTGVAVAMLGLYVSGTNLCLHRLLEHRGLVRPEAVEHTFAVLAARGQTVVTRPQAHPRQ